MFRPGRLQAAPNVWKRALSNFESRIARHETSSDDKKDLILTILSSTATKREAPDQRFAAQALGQERHPAAGAAPEARDPALGHAPRRLDQDPDPPAARPGNFAGYHSDPAEIGAAGRVSGFGARRKASDSSQRISASDSQRLCAPVRHANPDPAGRKSAGAHCQGPFRTGELLAARAVGSAAVARHRPNHIPDNGQER
ncbi:hypothetical protein KL937_000202 [Ogataea polymorpha]|nr:hypothetical protein KL937_000202 [Ogataea polymorpha]KAG7940484.1 hypothetical protein KL904_000347 [Ogataea polymorpha]